MMDGASAAAVSPDQGGVTSGGDVTSGAAAGLSRREMLKRLGGVAAGAAVGVGAFAGPVRAQAAKRPNVVLITADDLGPHLGAFGFPTPGTPGAARTPNLDAFAAGGVRFQQAYVTQASCSPSRASMLTGLYPHQNGQVGLAYQGSGFQMGSGVRTLPRMLHDDGYRTGIIGKLHVFPQSAFPFDYNDGFHSSKDVRGIANRAGAFVRRSGTNPFFLMVNYDDPHEPFQHKVPEVNGLPANPHPPGSVPSLPFQQIETPQVKEVVRGYRNGVSRLDAGIGLLMSELRSAGKLDNTLLIFLGDNGPSFPRGKLTCYESGVRTPLMIRFPGRHQAGQVRPQKLVSTVDLVPTVLEATGTGGPSRLPGRSLLPLLGSAPGGQVPWRTSVVTEFYAHAHTQVYPKRAVRNERFKYIVNLNSPRTAPHVDTGGIVSAAALSDAYRNTPQGKAHILARNPPLRELYDLQADPNEFVNLAGRAEHAAVLRNLQDRLDDWQVATADPLRSRTPR